MPKLTVHFSDNLAILGDIADESIDLIYIDPPFNTGREQRRTSIKVERADGGNDADRVGFGGKAYRTTEAGSMSYRDSFDDFIGFMRPRILEAKRVLKPNGSIFVHIDYRESHYLKVFLDTVFGRGSFMNEIIWAYDYGARSKSKWSPKHDTIFWYAKNPRDYQFHLEECDRIPYMAPSLVGPEKAARGKTPTDTWWHTIVSPTGKEKTGYPTQKPVAILERIVKVHSRPGDTLLDFFAGSGTFGEAAHKLGRDCILVDSNPEAISTMEKRFAPLGAEFVKR